MKRNKQYDLLFKTAYVLFIYSIGTLLTLYLHDAYYDVMEAKAKCLNIISIAIAPFLLALLFFKIKNKRFKINKSFIDVGLLLFLLISVVSSLASYSFEYAWNGSLGWYVGLSTILFLVLTIFVLKDEYLKETYIYYPLIFIVFIESMLTIISATELDLFSLKEFISGSDRYTFYGTLGNSNWAVGYYSLLVPFFFFRYLSEDNRKKNSVLFVVTLTGMIASIIIGADGIYLAYGLFVIITHSILFDNVSYIKRIAVFLITLGISLLFIRYCDLFSNRIEVMGGISRLMVYNNYLSIAAILLSLLAFILTRIISEEKYQIIKKQVVLIVRIVIGILIVFAAVLTLKNTNADFTNGRMDLWKASFEIFFNDYSLKEKILGVGPELLRYVYASLPEINNRIFVSSHNEFIQILLSLGISGLITWTICWIGVFKSFFVSLKEKDTRSIALCSGLFAYLGQSFVNSATTLNVCVLAFFVIILSQKK